MNSDLQHLGSENFIFDRGEVELLVISGPDSLDFLNRLSTLNFKKPIETSLHGAFLNGQAKVISLFTVWQKDSKNYFFFEKEYFSKTKEYLEKMHFAENLKIESEKYFCIEVRGKDVNFSSEIKVEAYNWGISGKYFFATSKFEIKSILAKDYDAIRAQFSYPKPLQDLTEDHIIIEAPLDSMVDRNKGCYPGQEVIEKIYTYGRVARKIKKVTFENATSADVNCLKNKLPLEIKHDGQTVGFLSSIHQYEKVFGLVTLKRMFYEKQQKFQIGYEDKALAVDIDQN